MTAVADANGLIDESDEFNNKYSLSVYVSEKENRADPFTIIEDTDAGSANTGILLLSITIVGLAAVAFLFGPRKIERPHSPLKERSKRR